MKKKPDSGSARKGIAFIWESMKSKRGVFMLAMIGTIVYNALQLVVPYYTGRLVDIFLSGENAAWNLQNNLGLFWQLVGLMVGLTILRVVIVYMDCLAYETASQHVLFKIRNELYDHVQRQDMSFYSRFLTGDLMTRLTGDLDAVRHMIAWVVRMLLECISLFTAAAIYFMITDWVLALSLLAVTPVIFFLVYRFRIRVRSMHELLREKFAGMNTAAQENISGNRIVKAFAREQYEIEKFDVCNKDFQKTNVETQMTWIRYYPYIESCANLLPLILMILGGLRLISGDLQMGQYVTISGLIWAVCNPMRQLGGILNEFQRFAAASSKIIELRESEAKIKDKDNAVDKADGFKGKVEFKHVSFCYEDSDLPVLKDISLTVNPGETVAIMGETGCGKTSLINLIPRFYDCTGGEVLVDGVNVKDLKMHQLRKSIGLANQDVLLFSDTVEGNISYGNNELLPKEVEKYAKYSAARNFIEAMPDRYETIVGERGVGLSGGQKQRLSLARALAIKPSILILDDTTSAVDMETEKEIQFNIHHLDTDCTKIIIAQRVSTTRSCDRIYIMCDGEIAEEGTHEELIRKKGWYYELVKLQTGLDEELEALMKKEAV